MTLTDRFLENRLKIYNLDMHISIIHDVQTIFTEMGHTVDSDNLSNHTWVNGHETAKNKVINYNNFKNIDEKICEKFYKKYKKQLSHYDAFVHSYPPVFALLFERFEKPIITIACTRFDFPVSKDRFDWYISRLESMYESGQLVPVANNLLDKKICEEYSSIEWEHISSLCSYMDTRYAPVSSDFILWSRSNLRPNDLSVHLDPKFAISEKYNRDDISKYSGVIHIPYNLSIMSAFEQYFQNIPLFFPSINFQKELFAKRDDMLSEILFPNSSIDFDPNWIELADWYDSNNMPEVVFFDSFHEIDTILAKVDLKEISSKMKIHNELRKIRVFDQWTEVLGGIK